MPLKKTSWKYVINTTSKIQSFMINAKNLLLSALIVALGNSETCIQKTKMLVWMDV